MRRLTDEGSTAGLNGLDLGSAESSAAEACRELGDVECDTLRGVNRAEAGAGGTANTTVSANGLLQRTVLLGVVAVGAEGSVSGRGRAVAVVGEVLGERSGRGGRVRLGRMVNVGRNGARTNEPNERNALSVDSSLSESSSGGEHYDRNCGIVVVN